MNWNLVLLAVVTIAVVVLVIFTIQLVQRLTRVAAAMEETLKTINDLSPRIEAVLISAERELDHLGDITERLDHIVADVENTTRSVSTAMAPIAANVATLWKPVRFVSALVTGLRTGASALSALRGATKGQSDPYIPGGNGQE